MRKENSNNKGISDTPTNEDMNWYLELRTVYFTFIVVVVVLVIICKIYEMKYYVGCTSSKQARDKNLSLRDETSKEALHIWMKIMFARIIHDDQAIIYSAVTKVFPFLSSIIYLPILKKLFIFCKKFHANRILRPQSPQSSCVKVS